MEPEEHLAAGAAMKEKHRGMSGGSLAIPRQKQLPVRNLAVFGVEGHAFGRDELAVRKR
jgi:hypothetical protein